MEFRTDQLHKFEIRYLHICLPHITILSLSVFVCTPYFAFVLKRGAQGEKQNPTRPGSFKLSDAWAFCLWAIAEKAGKSRESVNTSGACFPAIMVLLL